VLTAPDTNLPAGFRDFRSAVLHSNPETPAINWFVQMVVKGYVILMAVVLDQMKKRR